MNPHYLHLLLIPLWLLYLLYFYYRYFGYVGKLRELPDQKRFSLAIFGDCQGADNPFTSSRPTYFVFNNILESINRSLPLATVILGDMVVSGRAYHYHRFRRQLQCLNTPVYLIPGNHDLKHNGLTIFKKLFGPTYYSLSIGSNTLLFLNNASGSLDQEQMDWLETQLKNNQGNRLFVFMHQPLFDPRPGESYAMTDRAQADRLQELFSRSSVSAVFSSHLHGYYKAVRDKVSYFISGGGGSTLTSIQDYYHYLLLHIDHDRFNVEVVKISALPSAGLIRRWIWLIGLLIISGWVTYYSLVH